MVGVKHAQLSFGGGSGGVVSSLRAAADTGKGQNYIPEKPGAA